MNSVESDTQTRSANRGDGMVFRRNGNVVATDLADGEIALMSLEAGAYFGLNGTAARVWELLVKPHSAAALSEIFVQRLNIDRPECTAHIYDFLNEMCQQGLILRSTDHDNGSSDNEDCAKQLNYIAKRHGPSVLSNPYSRRSPRQQIWQKPELKRYPLDRAVRGSLDLLESDLLGLTGS